MKKFFLVLSLLLSLGTFCACSNDEEESPSSCISGTIFIQDPSRPYVYFDNLKMPKDSKYSYIEVVAVLKDEFPVQNYHTGDIVDFEIVEVKESLPYWHVHVALYDYGDYADPARYLCSIKLCK
ncbi:MAG: hypothetical protein IJV44_06825 [Prevotella sp.]|nr:hypothetical protein [Prevotella sp.]